MMKISEMPKYEVYKDSGVEWIGKIPEHWNLKSLKRVVKEHSGNGFPIELQGQAGDIPFLKVSDLSCEGILVDKSSNRVSHKVVQKQKWNIVPAGSLVTAKIGEALRKNHRKLLAYDSIIDNNCIAFECVKIEKKYNFYLHLVIDFDWFVNPGAVPSISVSKYKSQKVVVPSMKEQVLIANFLDKKTALIDEAISIKEQQISLLKERKQIIIQQAVTQGLDPNVPMKDSGVDWIGKIPQHWKLKPNKCLFKLKKSLVGKRSGDYELLSLTLKGIIKRDMDNPEGKFPAEFNTYQEVSVGDFVFCLFDVEETPRTVGLSKFNGMITGAYTVFELDESVSKEFLYYFYLNLDSRKMMRPLYKGLRNTISKETFLSFKSFIPPLKEQEEIVDFIEYEVNKIDLTIDGISEQIDKIKEYKSCLINGSVTGKIKVTSEMAER